MSKQEELKRLNIRMGKDLHSWFEVESNKLGIATTALMIIALNDYRKQHMTVENVPNMLAVYEQMRQSASL